MPVEGVMKLTKSERMELQRQAGARNGRADVARHARLILLLSEGRTWAEIRAKLDCSDSYIDRWSKRFAADRLAGPDRQRRRPAAGPCGDQPGRLRPHDR